MSTGDDDPSGDAFEVVRPGMLSVDERDLETGLPASLSNPGLEWRLKTTFLLFERPLTSVDHIVR